jgi:hypothetical protein
MLNQELTNYFSFKNLNRERKQREVYLESMKKEAEQKKQQAERIDRRAVRCHTIIVYFCVKTLTTTTSNTKTCI